MNLFIVIIILLLITAISIIIYLVRKKHPTVITAHLEKIKELDIRISILKDENDTLKNYRETLENESRENFNSDVGKSVAADLSKP